MLSQGTLLSYQDKSREDRESCLIEIIIVMQAKIEIKYSKICLESNFVDTVY